MNSWEVEGCLPAAVVSSALPDPAPLLPTSGIALPCGHRSPQLDLDPIIGEPLKDFVELGSQTATGHLGVVPDQAERPLGTPPARYTIVEGVTVPAEVAARPVDGLADGAVEAFDVGNVASIELVGAAGRLVRRIG